MEDYLNKAIIYDGPEDTYGPCGCGMDMAIMPVLIPKIWFEDCFPQEAENDEFCKGLDCRRIAGLSCNNIFEEEIDDIPYLGNFSCCRECAQRAVDVGYGVMAGEEYLWGLAIPTDLEEIQRKRQSKR